MNIRRFRVLHAAGRYYAEIARECGVDWRTVKKYLAEDASSVPPSGPPRLRCPQSSCSARRTLADANPVRRVMPSIVCKKHPGLAMAG